ncbi:LegC family aminotransferase [Luminiphilus sp.]|nr:LegC family aminotransferase [Luminiphilus sp.]
MTNKSKVGRSGSTNALIELTKAIFESESEIPLHRPVFNGSEVANLTQCIESNFVSSVGEKVVEFEQAVRNYVGSAHGIAVVNGTNALQVALKVVGVEANTEVITQALTFVATCNAVSYLNAVPVFVDVDRDTMGMSPRSLEAFLKLNAYTNSEGCFNRNSGRRIAACQPMHTFGHPCRIDEIAEICSRWNLPLIEDAAESLGSYYKGRSTGTFGRLGVFSFNGNKIITTGGGGILVTDDGAIAIRAKHLTTTAKVPHSYEFVHDELGYNFRMPNLNAALGCAQMDQLPEFLIAKRAVAERYGAFCLAHGVEWVREPEDARSNYWLNAIILQSKQKRDRFLHETNAAGVMTRPIWRLMVDLPMYAGCQHDGLVISRWLEERVVCLPSSVP